jgi:tetratricopeptide (TPR) repeat protein
VIGPLFGADASANAQFAEAEAARQAGDFDRALTGYLDLLRRRLARRRQPETGDRILLERVADLAVPFGQYEAADHFLEALAVDHARAGRDFLADYATLKRIQVALAAENTRQALELLQSLQPRIGPLDRVPIEPDALPIWENRCRWTDSRVDRELLFSRLYLGMGQWLAGQGQYGHAAVLLERGLAHSAPPASSLACRALLPLRLHLAGVLLEQGRLDECGVLHAGLGEELDAHESPGWTVQWLEQTGQSALLRGDYGVALERFARVIDLCKEGGFVRATIGALLNQAQILILVNQVSVAEEALDEALSLAHALDDRPALARAAWLFRLAHSRTQSLLGEAGVHGAATEVERPAEDPSPLDDDGPSPLNLPQAANFLAFFEDRALAVQWLLSRGDVSRADQLLDDMHQTFGECESYLVRLRLQVLNGMVAYHGGDVGPAARLFAEVCPHLDRFGLKPELWQVLRFRGWCAARLGAPPEEQGQLTRQTRELMGQLAASLPAAQRAIYLLNKWTVEEKGFLQELDTLVEMREAVERSSWFLRPWRRWKLWRRLHTFLERLDEHRRQLASGSAPRAGGVRPSLWRWLWKQRWRQATLSFLVLPDRVLVARSSWMSLDFTVAPLTRLRVRELVAGWHRRMAEWGESPHDAPEMEPRQQALVTELAEGLHLPELLQRLPRRIKRLTLVADDALHGFPFAALALDDGRLLDRFAITMQLDRTELPAAARPGHPVGALAVGVSRAVSIDVAGERLSAPSLPGVLPEVEQMRAWFKRHGCAVEVLLDEQADRAGILDRCRRVDWLHLACHGIFRPDRPDASGLVLAPQVEQVEVLSLRDLGEADLSRVRHVTLSCCWGADNFVLPGRWIISLPETLCRGGVESVLACLWQVDDEVGQAFVRRFHEHLCTKPRDLALQATQQECRENRLLPPEHPRHTAHPFFWAGYRLHGRSDRLILARS